MTIHSYYAICIPVHPGRGLGHDGDHRWGGCGVCGFGETFIRHPGANGWSRGYYGPLRLKWLNNPSGKQQTPCDLGLCKCQPEAKTAAKAWARNSRHPPDHTTGIIASFASTQPFASFSYLRKRNNRFHQGRSFAQCSLTSESVTALLPPRREEGSNCPADALAWRRLRRRCRCL